MTELFHNIRSLYRFASPCEELHDYIEFFSESCFEATRQIVSDESFSIKMFKSWTPTFWINLGPSYHLVLNGMVHQIKAGSAIAVTRAVTAERVNHPLDHLFSIKFHPGALHQLMGIDQTKLNSGLIELTEFLPYSLIQQLKSAGYFEERISLMEQHLLRTVRNKKSTDHYLQLVTQTIGSYNENALKFNLNELASKTFISSKTLRRYFDRVIGISPKKYLESIRVRTALPSFLSDRKSFDPVTYGYFDKSHFYRSVTSFTGERIGEMI